MNPFTRQSVAAVAKLGVAGATIAAIGWGVITFYPSTTIVKESEADIVSLVTFKRSSTQRFASALQAMGHDEPRSYDYNGNTVYFSSRTTTDSPEQVLREVQNILVRHGINERAYLEASEDGGPRPGDSAEEYEALIEERSLAMLSGQLVPSVISRDYVAMGGGLIEGEPTTCAEAAKVLDRIATEGEGIRGPEDFEKIFRGYRGIEAMRSEDGKRTFVTASWSDSDLDIRKHKPTDPMAPVFGTNPDPLIPSCPGCSRLTRFAGTGKEKGYVTNTFSSPQHHSTVTDFYLEAMANRGWKETEASAMTRQALEYTTYRNMPTEAVQLVRGEEFLTVTVDPTPNGSLVTTMTSP